MTTNATINELHQALRLINLNYDGNISFETLKQVSSKRISFTLRAKSGLIGARKSASGRNMPKASWHVHGELFDTLFKINPTIFIISLGKKITITGGNWQDQKIGGDFSNYQYMSETSVN